MNEKEAIQILKNMNIEISGTSTCKECIYDDETHCFRDGKDCQMQAIETVLNLLEKRQNKIQELEKALIDDDYKHRAEIQKKDKQIEQYQNMLATNDMLHVLECEKKDKMIDEIIGFLATRTWATCPNEDCGANLDCENRCSNDDNIYKECWKMYFERKVENGN